MKPSCQLYQLASKSALPVGAYVAVNGPHDKYGYILKSEKQADGQYLNLIRGCHARIGQTIVASF